MILHQLYHFLGMKKIKMIIFNYDFVTNITEKTLLYENNVFQCEKIELFLQFDRF